MVTVVGLMVAGSIASLNVTRNGENERDTIRAPSIGVTAVMVGAVVSGTVENDHVNGYASGVPCASRATAEIVTVIVAPNAKVA